MEILSIKCGLPFVNSSKNEAQYSKYLRITGLVIGVLALVAGVIMLTNAFTRFEFQLGCAVAAVSLIVATIPTFLYCKKSKTEKTPDLFTDAGKKELRQSLPAAVEQTEPPFQERFSRFAAKMDNVFKEEFTVYQQCMNKRNALSRKLYEAESTSSELFLKVLDPIEAKLKPAIQQKIDDLCELAANIKQELGALSDTKTKVNLEVERSRLTELEKELEEIKERFAEKT